MTGAMFNPKLIFGIFGPILLRKGVSARRILEWTHTLSRLISTLKLVLFSRVLLTRHVFRIFRTFT